MTKDLTNLNEHDQKYIADCIENGNTSGRFDTEDENGNAIYGSWTLSFEKWQD